MPELASQSHEHHRPSLWPIAVLGAAGALIAAPYLLPILGIGTSATTSDVIDSVHVHGPNNIGSGLAGFLAGGLGKIPGIGPTLAAGGWGTIAASSIIGVGGVLFANWLEKREDPTKFPWSKVIRYGAIATSMLISLPAILTGVSVGITFLASFFIKDASTFNSLTHGLSTTLGSASMAVTAGSGSGVFATMLAHLISCGAGIIPASLSYFMGKQTPSTTVDTNSVSIQKPLKPLHAPQMAL